MGLDPVRPSPELLAALQAKPWPGNVRELENCIESAVVVTEGDTLEPGDLALTERPPQLTALHEGAPGEPVPLGHVASGSHVPAAASPPASSIGAAQTPVRVSVGHAPDTDGPIDTLAEVERRHILAVMARVGGHRSQAARLLGIGRNTLTRKLKQYGL